MKRLMLAVMFSSILFTGCANQKVDNASNINENVDAITEAHFGTEESEETKESDDEVLKIDISNTIEDSNMPSKSEYVEKIHKLEAELEVSLKDKYDSGVTLDMIEASDEELAQWSAMLNDISGVLKASLSSEEYDKYNVEQTMWLEEALNNAQESSSEFEGGSFASVNYSFSLTNSTKDRCFELIELYFK